MVSTLRFAATIELGNDAMLNGRQQSGKVLDENGNSVGEFELGNEAQACET